MSKTRYQQYKDKGLCPCCGKPTNDFIYCLVCRTRKTKSGYLATTKCIVCNQLFDAPRTGQKTCSNVCQKVWEHQSTAKLAKIRYQARKKTVLSLLGNKCIRCGNEDIRVLQIDHINGNGSQERKLLKHKGQDALFRKILTVGTDGYQLLCANCNWIKRFENEEY